MTAPSIGVSLGVTRRVGLRSFGSGIPRRTVPRAALNFTGTIAKSSGVVASQIAVASSTLNQ
jgi:hypothetical protein